MKYLHWHSFWTGWIACSVFMLVLMFLTTGCTAFEPTGAMPYTPPASYRAAWDSAEACTGLHREYDRIRFWVVPGDGFYRGDEALAGYTDYPDIWIAERYIAHPMVVKHEMIHALGINSHPRVPFVDPCRATWDSYARAE